MTDLDFLAMFFDFLSIFNQQTTQEVFPPVFTVRGACGDEQKLYFHFYYVCTN